MKMYEIIKCKRLAIGWTQAELAAMCGVSPSTISQFEQGELVSVSVHKNIVNTVDGYIRRLNDVERNRVFLVQNALGLSYQIPEEQIRTLAYMNINLGSLHIAVMNNLNAENKRFL